MPTNELATAIEAADHADVRVLVVEDSPDHQALMRRRLATSGWIVLTASNASDALAQVEQDQVDLVLLDYRLPGDTGLEVLRTIHARPDAPSVVMVTGAGSTDVAVSAMREGAIDYLAKDHGYLDQLPDVVARAWRHHDLQRRAAELQRLALLVSGETERGGLFHEIVSGALRLLRGGSAALLIAEPSSLVPVTILGDPPEDPRSVVDAHALRSAAAGEQRPRVDQGRLIVPLPRDAGPSVGLLVLWGDGRHYTDDDIQLARVFAAFAGMAIRNLQRRELERNLVAELEQTVAARRDFIASVSHELRTPLTCIEGFASTLHDHWQALGDDVVIDLLGRLRRNSVDLHHLVDDLIDLSSLDRGERFPVDLAAFPLDERIQEAVVDATEVLMGREVTVDIPGIDVVADLTLVRRILANLVSNAVKFSPVASPIDIRGRVDGDVVRIEVQDHGIGLEPRVAARVFDPFFRAQQSVANAVRGSGIGLALVREYVRTMGGQVGVHSIADEGSTFWFTLPIAVASADVSPPEPARP